MERATYVEHNGTEHSSDLRNGMSVIKRAVSNGIDADCGERCACPTCHVELSPKWSARMGDPLSEHEDDLLELAPERSTGSRLPVGSQFG